MCRKRSDWHAWRDKIDRYRRLSPPNRRWSAETRFAGEVSPRRRGSEQKGNQRREPRRNAPPVPFYEHSGASGNCVTSPDAGIHRYLRITYAHEPSIRYLENRKAQSKHLLPQRRARAILPRFSRNHSRIPRRALSSPWFFSISAAAPDIPEGSVCWEQSARPRNFRSDTTDWSATSCTWSSRKFCRWH